MQSKTLKVWNFEAPGSADPMLYDAGVHHVAFTAVFAKLVRQYCKGRFVGILAKDWAASPDFTEWQFHLRASMKFSDGTPITPQIILNNFKRMAFLMGRRQSYSELFDSLKDYKRLEAIDQNIPGLFLRDEKLIFQFSKPMSNLLEVLSFGLFGILHPSQFDTVTGEFLAANQRISSGRYSIESWSEKEIIYKLRGDFLPEIFPKNNFERIQLFWRKGKEFSADIVSHYSSQGALARAFEFFGPTESGIIFLHVLYTRAPNSIFSEKINRQAFREQLYRLLSQSGMNISRSFLPSVILDNSEPTANPSGSITPLKAPAEDPKLVIRVRPSIINAIPRLIDGVVEAGRALGVEVVVGDPILANDVRTIFEGEATQVDLIGMITGISVKKPRSDIRFMFESKEGIRLSDETGEIRAIVKSDQFDLQQVNQKITEQALVWPIGHTAWGLWVRPTIDLSQLNTLLPPTDFGWIGYKE